MGGPGPLGACRSRALRRATPVSVADVATQAAPVVSHVGVVTSRPRRCSTASGPVGDHGLDGLSGGDYDAGLSYDPAVDDYDFLAVRARMAAGLALWYGASVDGLMDLPLPAITAAQAVLRVAVEASSTGSEAGSSAAGAVPWLGGATGVAEASAGASSAWRVGDRVRGPFSGVGEVAYLTPRGTRFEVNGPGGSRLFEASELWPGEPSSGSSYAPWNSSGWRSQPWHFSRRRR